MMDQFLMDSPWRILGILKTLMKLEKIVSLMEKSKNPDTLQI